MKIGLREWRSLHQRANEIAGDNASRFAAAARYFQTRFATPIRDRWNLRSLAAWLKAAIRTKDVALLDYPDYSNVGDHLIWLGEKVILKEMLGLRIVYAGSAHTVRFDDLSNLGDIPLICTGGGNFGDLYSVHQGFREALLLAFPGRQIVFMPQTIHYRDPAAFLSSPFVESDWRELTICARDRRSVDFLRKTAGHLNVRLQIDAAFALRGTVRKIAREINSGGRTPLLLMRTDIERSDRVSPLDGAVSTDWVDDAVVDTFLSDAKVDYLIDKCDLRRLIDFEWEEKSLSYLVRSVALIASANFVVTDRLHGHILSRLLGRPNLLIDNSYGKNAGFLETWGR